MIHAFDSLLPPGEGGAQRGMRAQTIRLMMTVVADHCHALIRPSGTFSREEKETALSSNRP